MGGEPLGRLPQQQRHRRIVRGDEGRQKLRHIGDAAPFVTGEKSDGVTALVQDLGAGDETEGYLPLLSLVQAGEVTGVEFDFPVAKRKIVARNDPIDRP